MAGGSTFTWSHALQLHSTLSPFDSPLPITHSGFNKNNIKPVSWQRRNIAGHLLTLYGLEELPANTSEVTCLWLLHGRGDTQDSMSYVCAALLNAWSEQQQQQQSRRRSKSSTTGAVIGITFDQRNHGSRMIDNVANVSWKQGNPTHGPDMYNLYCGTASDLSFLLTHLPSYLPFEFSKHVACGLSLGGHALWQLLVNEPRIEAGIVVIGCPDYVRLMTDRAVRAKLPSTQQKQQQQGEGFLGSSDFPRTLISDIEAHDPAGLFLSQLDAKAGDDEHLAREPSAAEIKRLRPILRERLGGKKILCLSGAKDRLVPYAQGEPFLSWLKKAVEPQKGWAGDLGIEVVDVVDGDGRHDFTPKLRGHAERWFCDLLAAASDESGAAVARGSKL